AQPVVDVSPLHLTRLTVPSETKPQVTELHPPQRRPLPLKLGSDAGVGPIGNLQLILPENTFENGGSSTDKGSLREVAESRTASANWTEFRYTTVVNTFAVAADEATATSGWIGADLDVVRLFPPSRRRRRKLERRAVREFRKIAPNHPMAATGLRRRRRVRR
ncbi:MAG: hypothetical protein LC808_16185, partial [Actinobacteria bacterium]|nr:hypothetical protein [Actinomycetota bacterium]